MSCSVGGRRGSDPELLWLWSRLAATAPVNPLDWEPPYVAGTALKRQKKKLKLKLKRCLKHSLIFFWEGPRGTSCFRLVSVHVFLGFGGC